MFDADDLPAFESPEFDDEHLGESDGEPPPLRGSTRPPAGLHDVDWAALDDAYGTAARTPLFIEALTSDDDADRNFGAYGLYSATTHQGSVTASGAAIPFLVELVRRDNSTALLFLARIAVGETHFVTRPDDVVKATSEYAGTVAEFAADVEAMWTRTGDDQALRLLVLLGREPEELPALAPGATAGLCLAHAFLAARDNGVTPGTASRTGSKVDHLAAARDLMANSPSLYVRGAAAACVVYSGFADADALALLHHLAQGEYPVNDAWTTDLAELAVSAWIFGTDDDGLLAAPQDTWPNLYTRLLERMARQFRPSGEVYRPLSPEELSAAQRTTLETALLAAPEVITGSDAAYLSIDVPSTVAATHRLLGTATGELTRRTSRGLLWFVLENGLLAQGDKESALAALAEVNVWAALGEVFAARQPGAGSESITLTVRHIHSDDGKNDATLVLCSTFADALADYRPQAEVFLDEWLRRVSEVDGYDLAFAVPGQRIGTALAALARSGELPARFHPMIKAYHRFPRYSRVPLPLLRELAAVLPADIRTARLAEWQGSDRIDTTGESFRQSRS
ncbi:hypothetical protein [Umezawaea sp. Da 62-37]|uniref:hypothetical protein n=1 Tax=Umezawaea sp. Da 62-37 TaxID=3075927 RepID=UPI0028F73BAE|nr:hypothetical protein [Umezawaea sp. Da 62-37]WNV87555.1 hypothetical protein RM788_04435 [Umezawaea sp. Da 62-37]